MDIRSLAFFGPGQEGFRERRTDVGQVPLPSEHADAVVEALLPEFVSGGGSSQPSSHDHKGTFSAHSPDRRSVRAAFSKKPRLLPVNAQILVL
jgi:hypothetical protein